MSFSSLFLACGLALPQGGASLSEDPASAATKIGVALKEAAAPAISVIERLGRLADPRVTRAVGEGLKHDDADVRAAAIKALRFNKDKSAVSELLEVRSRKNIVEHEALGAEYYLALGQHADGRALPTLLRDLAKTKAGTATMRGRVLALGRMRKTSAIEPLIRLTVSRQHKKLRADVDLALTALTGQNPEAGRSRVSWAKWWADHRHGYHVPKEPPKLSERDAREWERIWREPGTGEPAPRKGKSSKEQDRRRRRDG